MELSPEFKINFFLGAHRTASQHLFHTLDQHPDVLSKAGTYVPTMLETGRALSIVVQSLNQNRDINAVRQDFFDAIMAGAEYEVKTLLIISKGMLGPVHAPFSPDGIYSSAAKRCQMLVNLLQGFDVDFYMATRSPIPFAISCYGEAVAAGQDFTLQDFMAQIPAQLLTWSVTIENILTVLPAERLTVWPFEDYPKIGKKIAAEMGRINEGDLTKKLRPINVGLSLEGIEMLQDHLNGTQHPSPEEMRKLFDQYVESYPSHELPRNHKFFTPEVIEHLKYAYEDDWYYIERIDGLKTSVAQEDG